MGSSPSGREMADIAVASGAIDLAQGVVHLTPPLVFQQLLNHYFSQRRCHIYSSPAGFKGYREALVHYISPERASLSLDSIMATTGVTGGLTAALLASARPGADVLLFEPFYPAHEWAIKALHFKPHYVPYSSAFSLNWERIEAAIPQVKICLIANPGNPTGLVLSAEELVRLYALCQKHDVLLLVDEVYKDFIWEGRYASLLSLAESFSHLVILRSFSKNLALAGWRAGYAVTTSDRLRAMTHIHDALQVGAPTMPQFILADMLTNYQKEIKQFIRQVTTLYQENRSAVVKAFTGYGMNPLPAPGAYYMLVKHNQADDMVAMKNLLDKGIATAPGVPFWRPGTKDTGYLRIHFAVSLEDRKKVVDRLTT